MMTELTDVLAFCAGCFASSEDGSWDLTCDNQYCYNCGTVGTVQLPRWAVDSIREQASWVGKRYYPADEDKEAAEELAALRALAPLNPYNERAAPMSLKYRDDPTETVQGVAFILLRDAEVLMEKCPKKAARHGGEWFIPGGRIEEEDESEFMAFIREMEEELGVYASRYRTLPLVDACGGADWPSFLMRPYLVTEWDGELPDHTLDHPDVPLRWVPVDEARRSPVAAVRVMMALMDAPVPIPQEEHDD